jgi:outer membrane protein assembly factor BamA
MPRLGVRFEIYQPFLKYQSVSFNFSKVQKLWKSWRESLILSIPVNFGGDPQVQGFQSPKLWKSWWKTKKNHPELIRMVLLFIIKR